MTIYFNVKHLIIGDIELEAVNNLWEISRLVCGCHCWVHMACVLHSISDICIAVSVLHSVCWIVAKGLLDMLHYLHYCRRLSLRMNYELCIVATITPFLTLIKEQLHSVFTVASQWCHVLTLWRAALRNAIKYLNKQDQDGLNSLFHNIAASEILLYNCYI